MGEAKELEIKLWMEKERKKEKCCNCEGPKGDSFELCDRCGEPMCYKCWSVLTCCYNCWDSLCSE